MKHVGYLKSGQHVFSNGKHSANQDVVMAAVGLIIAPPDFVKEVTYTVKLKTYQGQPAVLERDGREVDMLYSKREPNMRKFPFAKGDSTDVTTAVTVTLELLPGKGYKVISACFGVGYPRDSEDPFWDDHAFNSNVIPFVMKKGVIA